MDSELRNPNDSGPTTPIRTTNLSRRLSSSNRLSGFLAPSESKDYRLNADYNVDSDHTRITMKTRVAVRDKTPHRFQVVPLRDVSKLTASEDGRPSQLALPLPSHTLLRSASIRRQTYSQVRPGISSSYSQDINAQYDCNVLANSETLVTPRAEMLAMPVLTLSPSFQLENVGGPYALAEQDMNRLCTKSTAHKFASSISTPTNTLKSYDASYHTHTQNPFPLDSDRSPSVQTTSAHTTSQSVYLASCNGGAYPKTSNRITSEHLLANAQSSILNSKSPRKKRTRSENIPSIRDRNQKDGHNPPAATVTQESCDSRMTKRHAIYTQSLYVPFLESPSYFPGNSLENRKEHHQLFGVHSYEEVSDSHKTHYPERVSFNQMSQAFVSDSGATLPNTSSDDQSSVEVVPSEKSVQLLTVKPRASEAAPYNGPHRGLNYRRLSRVYPLSAETKLHAVYPQIVCEMFTEIDQAIHEWGHIYLDIPGSSTP